MHLRWFFSSKLEGLKFKFQNKNLEVQVKRLGLMLCIWLPKKWIGKTQIWIQGVTSLGIFQWVQVVLNTWFDYISMILLVMHLTCCTSMYISMGTLLMRILICQYLRPMCLHLRSIWILLWIFVALDGSEWVLGENEFWSIWGSVFYLFCVRVTENGEVGYGWVTVRITGG